MQDTPKTLEKSAQHFFSGTLLSRISGFFREISMAFVFGTLPLVAAFWMAYRFVHLFRRLLGEGSLQTTLIPHFESLRKKQPQQAAFFFYELSCFLAYALLALTLVIEGILGGCLLFASPKPENREVLRLTMAMLPALVFICLYALNAAILQCERIYFLPSIAPLALNCVWIASVWLLRKLPSSQSIEILTMMLVLGFALQWIVTLPKTYQSLSRGLKGKWWKEKRNMRKELISLMRPFLMTLLGVGAVQINSALDTLFARAAHPQAPAYLWYALRLQQLPLALLGIGLFGAFLPAITRVLQSANPQQSPSLLSDALKRAVALMLPLSFAFFALGFSSINLVYGRGAFTERDVFATTYCLWAYGIALLPMTGVLLLASVFYAQKQYFYPTLVSLITVGLNIALNALFVFVFKWGAISVACATACASIFNVALLILIKKEFQKAVASLVTPFCKILLCSLCAAGVTMAVSTFLWRNTAFSEAVLPAHARHFFYQLGTFLKESLVFVGTFIFTAWLVKAKDLLVWKAYFPLSKFS